MTTLPMHTYPPETSLILVAILPSPQDLEIARLLGWYRIPLKRAPKVVDVDYLAFYQTAAFGESERWQIRTVAPVAGHELVTRGELLHSEPSHPRFHEEYYKIALGPLQTLPSPIPAEKWRRITFFYTTGERLRLAKRIHDLVVVSEERQVLWSSLRERALHTGEYQTSELPEMSIDPSILEFFTGFLTLQTNSEGTKEQSG